MYFVNQIQMTELYKFSSLAQILCYEHVIFSLQT